MSCVKFVFPIADTTSKVFFLLINTTVMMTSLLGNGIVMFVIITRQRLHQPTYYLIFSLALSDFITASIGQMIYTIEMAFMDNTSCTLDKIITVLNTASGSTSLILLCMISRDRLLHVEKGLRYNEYTSKKQVILISVTCWLIGLSIGLAFCIEGINARIFSSLGLALNGTACFIAICIINIKVHRIVNNHLNDMENNRQDDGQVQAFNNIRSRQRQERAKVEQSVNRSIITVIAVYSISWFPAILLLTISSIQILQGKLLTPETVTAIGWVVTMCYFNGAINPFVYAYRCDSIGSDIRAFASSLKAKVFPESHEDPI